MAIPIEKFQEQGGRLKTDDLDFEAFRRQPLPPHVLRCLSYMHDIEYQTVLYTRELLLLPAWKDPQFTAFLTLWNYEEYWHGQALGKVLAAHDWPAHDTRLVAMRRFNKRYLFWSPAIFWLLGHGVRKFPAVHMTWGAINEWTANAAYNRLAQIADHPVLTELLGRIMRQEGRHAAYYASYARDLLEGDPRAQRVLVRGCVPVRLRRRCPTDRARGRAHRRAARFAWPQPGAYRHRRGHPARVRRGGQRAGTACRGASRCIASHRELSSRRVPATAPGWPVARRRWCRARAPLRRPGSPGRARGAWLRSRPR